MPSHTPRFRIPYPVSSDPIRSSVFKDLAERVETLIAGIGSGGDPGDGDGPGIGSSPPILRYGTQSISGGKAGAGSHLLCTVDIPDPGYPYKLAAYGAFEAGHFQDGAEKPMITARVGSSSGTIVGRGQGPNLSDWHDITVVPYVEAGTDPQYTGTQSVKYYGTSALSTREVQFSDFKAHAYVEILPAI